MVLPSSMANDRVVIVFFIPFHGQNVELSNGETVVTFSPNPVVLPKIFNKECVSRFLILNPLRPIM